MLGKSNVITGKFTGMSRTGMAGKSSEVQRKYPCMTGKYTGMLGKCTRMRKKSTGLESQGKILQWQMNSL